MFRRRKTVDSILSSLNQNIADLQAHSEAQCRVSDALTDAAELNVKRTYQRIAKLEELVARVIKLYRDLSSKRTAQLYAAASRAGTESIRADVVASKLRKLIA